MSSHVISIIPHAQWMADMCATRCTEPGHCCKSFNLANDAGAPYTRWDDDDSPTHPESPCFVPLVRWGQWTVEGGPDVGRTYSAWRWRCTNLVDGRCSDYANRPQLCRDYEPLTDGLCIMHKENAT